MSEPRYALAQRCQHSQEVRKSRFLAQAAPVVDAAQALAFLHEASDTTATHNCWAYRIGQDYRFNDDGEPGGTAGRPILQAIESQDIDNAVVVVTRWYGGIKLGAGGLARAYGGTAAECLRVAARTPIVAMATLTVACDFADLALLKSRLHELDAIVDSEDFTSAGANLRLRLPEIRVDEACARVTDITRGRSAARRID